MCTKSCELMENQTCFATAQKDCALFADCFPLKKVERLSDRGHGIEMLPIRIFLLNELQIRTISNSGHKIIGG